MKNKLGKFLTDLKRKIKNYKNAKYIKYLVKNPNTIIDVGCYKGEFSKACLNVFKDAQVIGIEPNEEMCLSHLNKIKNIRFMCFCFALSNETNYNGDFFVNLNRKRQSSLLQNTKEITTKKINIPILRFDSLKIPINYPAILKVDCEGNDLNVLKGFGDKLNHFSLIQIEVNFKNNFEGQNSPEDIINFLNKKRFKCLNYQKIKNQNKDFGDLLFIK